MQPDSVSEKHFQFSNDWNSNGSAFSCLPSSILPLSSEGILPYPQQAEALGIYDMLEIQVTCTQFPGSFLRIFGVNAGITLFNFYRAIMFSFDFDQDLAGQYLHIWILPDGTTFGNGGAFKEWTKKMPSLLTDKNVCLTDFLTLSDVNFSFSFIFGKMHCHLVVQDILAGQTQQQDLLWVPRLSEGSVGIPPPITSCADPFAVEQHNAQFGEVDVDAVNRELSRTRFGRNLASCRQTKRHRIESLCDGEESILRDYRMPIRTFFAHSAPATANRRSKRGNRSRGPAGGGPSLSALKKRAKQQSGSVASGNGIHGVAEQVGCLLGVEDAYARYLKLEHSLLLQAAMPQNINCSNNSLLQPQQHQLANDASGCYRPNAVSPPCNFLDSSDQATRVATAAAAAAYFGGFLGPLTTLADIDPNALADCTSGSDTAKIADDASFASSMHLGSEGVALLAASPPSPSPNADLPCSWTPESEDGAGQGIEGGGNDVCNADDAYDGHPSAKAIQHKSVFPSTVAISNSNGRCATTAPHMYTMSTHGQPASSVDDCQVEHSPSVGADSTNTVHTNHWRTTADLSELPPLCALFSGPFGVPVSGVPVSSDMAVGETACGVPIPTVMPENNKNSVGCDILWPPPPAGASQTDICAGASDCPESSSSFLFNHHPFPQSTCRNSSLCISGGVRKKLIEGCSVTAGRGSKGRKPKRIPVKKRAKRADSPFVPPTAQLKQPIIASDCIVAPIPAVDKHEHPNAEWIWVGLRPADRSDSSALGDSQQNSEFQSKDFGCLFCPPISRELANATEHLDPTAYNKLFVDQSSHNRVKIEHSDGDALHHTASA